MARASAELTDSAHPWTALRPSGRSRFSKSPQLSAWNAARSGPPMSARSFREVAVLLVLRRPVEGVAILRQHCRPGTALSVTTAVFDWRMIRPETHACGADEWRARWLDPANAYDRRIQDSEFSGKKVVGGISTKMNIRNHL